jgi:DNA-binding NtrC family response regulator
MNFSLIFSEWTADRSIVGRENIGGLNMARSFFIVVSDDHALVQKAQQFGQMHGVTVQVLTPDEYHLMADTHHSEEAVVPSLIAGASAVEGAKVLAFPQGHNASHTQHHGTGTVHGFGHGLHMNSGNDPKKGVATINQLEANAIESAIAAFRGNLTEAAKALGIGRATLYRKVKQYSIDPSSSRKKKAA